MLIAEEEREERGRTAPKEGSLPNAFTYTGRHWDAFARLYHYRARAYDPDTGSFLQHDPVFSANPYAYVDNDPVNYTDPYGEKARVYRYFMKITRAGKASSSVVGAALAVAPYVAEYGYKAGVHNGKYIRSLSSDDEISCCAEFVSYDIDANHDLQDTVFIPSPICLDDPATSNHVSFSSFKLNKEAIEAMSEEDVVRLTGMSKAEILAYPEYMDKLAIDW